MTVVTEGAFYIFKHYSDIDSESKKIGGKNGKKIS